MTDLVLVTGINGFIGRHLAKALLDAGYAVRGTLRDLERADGIRRDLAVHGAATADLEFIASDLERNDGWAEAVSDCRFVQHVAAPFPIRQPKGREDLVPAARDGALRVLDAALDAGVERFVLMSSLVTTYHRRGRPSRFAIVETDWSDPDWPGASPYVVAKTRAERAVWDEAQRRTASLRVVSINPGFVLGPRLGGGLSTSIGLIDRLMRGALPALVPVSYPVVDVRDVAAVGVAAMTAPSTGGRRLLAAEATLSIPEMAGILREALGPDARRIPRAVLPAILVRLLATVDREVRSITPDLGVVPLPQSRYTSALTGVSFRPARQTVIDTGRDLLATGARL